ncbi:hypothetical protein EV356DRAFT_308592 [Viridothelium virens]|uniref:Uncharacterized protein n=1 Tax=Viridothelium virens TaxID=1048519 RepID=A0A6A6HKS5_VIRVR|nr:hypothetical protein EV356DRAFT_308592 [Viridothelium virens]
MRLAHVSVGFLLVTIGAAVSTGSWSETDLSRRSPSSGDEVKRNEPTKQDLGKNLFLFCMTDEDTQQFQNGTHDEACAYDLSENADLDQENCETELEKSGDLSTPAHEKRAAGAAAGVGTLCKLFTAGGKASRGARAPSGIKPGRTSTKPPSSRRPSSGGRPNRRPESRPNPRPNPRPDSRPNRNPRPRPGREPSRVPSGYSPRPVRRDTGRGVTTYEPRGGRGPRMNVWEPGVGNNAQTIGRARGRGDPSWTTNQYPVRRSGDGWRKAGRAAGTTLRYAPDAIDTYNMVSPYLRQNTNSSI